MWRRALQTEILSFCRYFTLHPRGLYLCLLFLEIPKLNILINTTEVTESSVTILWRITNHIQPGSIKDACVSIYSLQVEDLAYKSPALKNSTSGQYTLTNLQPKMKYNVCVLVRTKQNAEVNKCIGVKTGRSTLGKGFFLFLKICAFYLKISNNLK